MNIIKQRLLALLVLLAGLRLSLPIYQHLFKTYFHGCDRTADLQTNVQDYDLLRRSHHPSTPPRYLAEDAEVILVSGYEAERNGDRVTVNIDRPHQKVLLVLSSYEAIDWQVVASPQTEIAGVLVSSYYPSTVIGDLDPQTVFSVDLPYSYELENRKTVELLQQLNLWFDVYRLDGFRGSYSLSSYIDIGQVDYYNPALTLRGYPIEQPTPNFKFHVYDRHYRPIASSLTNGDSLDKDRIFSNIISQTGIAISPDTSQVYQTTPRGIKIIDRQTGTISEFPLPLNFPELSWGMDIAYDSRRDLITLVSLGGEGYFYRFDVRQQRWLDVRSLNNVDLKSITYDRTGDRYLAWGENYFGDEGNLFYISPTGELLYEEQIGDRLPGFYRLYDRGNEMTPPVEIVAQDNRLALIARNRDNLEHCSNNSITSIWHYNLDLQTSQLTYHDPYHFSRLCLHGD